MIKIFWWYESKQEGMVFGDHVKSLNMITKYRRRSFKNMTCMWEWELLNWQLCFVKTDERTYQGSFPPASRRAVLLGSCKIQITFGPPCRNVFQLRIPWRWLVRIERHSGRNGRRLFVVALFETRHLIIERKRRLVWAILIDKLILHNT